MQQLLVLLRLLLVQVLVHGSSAAGATHLSSPFPL